jgi:hypothetical protein
VALASSRLVRHAKSLPNTARSAHLGTPAPEHPHAAPLQPIRRSLPSGVDTQPERCHDGLCTSGLASHGYIIIFIIVQYALLVRRSRRAHPVDQFFYCDVVSSSVWYHCTHLTRRAKMINFIVESWIWYGMVMSMVTLRLYEDESLLQPISNVAD